MNAEDRGFILGLSKLLKQAMRYGADADSPEGYVEMSDVVATQTADRLHAIHRRDKTTHAYFDPMMARITELVQNNLEFFEAKLADSCLELVADKLEGLIEERKAKKRRPAGSHMPTICGDGVAGKPKGRIDIRVHPLESPHTVFIGGVMEAAQRVRNAS